MKGIEFIDALIAARAQTHGAYSDKAALIQNLKDMMRASDGWDSLQPDQCESLDMIATKIGRILYGEPDVADHWNDIAGYARLIGRRF